MIMPLVASMLIAGFGWRRAYVIIGGLAMVVLVLIAQLLRRDPAHMGLPPEAARTETSGSAFFERETSFPVYKAAYCFLKAEVFINLENSSRL